MAKQQFSIETPDGRGNAVKDGRGKPWLVAVPTGDFRWWGTAPQIQSEIKRRLEGEGERKPYKPGEVTFGALVV